MSVVPTNPAAPSSGSSSMDTSANTTTSMNTSDKNVETRRRQQEELEEAQVYAKRLHLFPNRSVLDETLRVCHDRPQILFRTWMLFENISDEKKMEKQQQQQQREQRDPDTNRSLEKHETANDDDDDEQSPLINSAKPVEKEPPPSPEVRNLQKASKASHADDDTMTLEQIGCEIVLFLLQNHRNYMKTLQVKA